MADALVYNRGIPELVSEEKVHNILLGMFNKEYSKQITVKKEMLFHRPTSEGPAICWPDGSEEFWENGYIHREDGPAIVHPNGHIEWWVKGKLHNLKGPAIITTYDNIPNRYFINGEEYSAEDWAKKNQS